MTLGNRPLDEAVAILNGRGSVLDIAREVTALMQHAGIEGAIIGGVAVVLHGHIRTTVDVDVCAGPSPEPLADLLRTNGFEFDRRKREFIKAGVPVHLVLPEQFAWPPSEIVAIEQIVTVGLRDLIEMKLRSGLADPLRAQDIADVIGLIRHRRLSSELARRLAKGVRTEFRRLVKLVRRERDGAA